MGSLQEPVGSSPTTIADLPMPATRAPHLQGLSLQVTDACNLACSYCYFYDKSPVAMTEDIVDRALDLLESEVRSADWHINLFGGEPTLCPDLLEYICRETTRRARAGGNSATFSMTTNGTRFRQSMLDLVTKFGISTMLSIDGNERAHDTFRKYHNGRGSYQEIMANLTWLKRAPNFKVRLTVSPHTVDCLADSVSELVEAGIRSIATSPVVEADWTSEHFHTFAEQWQRVAALYLHERLRGRPLWIKGISLEKPDEPFEICKSVRNYGCGAATSFVFVNAFGDLYPCHRYPGYFDKSPQVRLGSVFTGIDAERRAHYVRANLATSKKGCGSFVSSSKATGTCPECAIQGACGGSCMAINENATGDPTQPPSVPGALEQVKLLVAGQVSEYLTAHQATELQMR